MDENTESKGETQLNLHEFTVDIFYVKSRNYSFSSSNVSQLT